MASRDQVMGLLREGVDYRSVAARLWITPGLAYLIATGVAVDHGEGLLRSPREGMLEGTSQSLINPGQGNSFSDPRVGSDEDESSGDTSAAGRPTGNLGLRITSAAARPRSPGGPMNWSRGSRPLTRLSNQSAPTALSAAPRMSSLRMAGSPRSRETPILR